MCLGDFFDVGDGDWSILFDDSAVRILLRLADGLLHDASALDNDLALGRVDRENGTAFALVVACDNFDFVTFSYVCFNTHCK